MLRPCSCHSDVGGREIDAWLFFFLCVHFRFVCCCFRVFCSIFFSLLFFFFVCLFFFLQRAEKEQNWDSSATPEVRRGTWTSFPLIFFTMQEKNEAPTEGNVKIITGWHTSLPSAWKSQRDSILHPIDLQCWLLSPCL